MPLHFMSIKGLGIGHSPNKQPMAPDEGHGHSIGEHSGALPNTFFSVKKAIEITLGITTLKKVNKALHVGGGWFLHLLLKSGKDHPTHS